MFAPKLYTVLKLEFRDIANADFDLMILPNDLEKYCHKQQDNQLFRQIRLITGESGKFNPYILFVECGGHGTRQELFSKMITDGFVVNGNRYVVCERSASMTRQSRLSFVDSRIADKLDKRISMGISFADKPTVLSKWYAYRGLMLSSCHCIEGWRPKFIVIPDCYRIIPDQTIKYIYDKETTFEDKEGNIRLWTQKDVAEGTRDIKINCFDGCGIHHPALSNSIKDLLNSRTLPTSILLRLPYIKGLSHEVDYVSYYRDKGISSIRDIWGIEHSVLPDAEPMFILTESMYKGYKYFKNKGTSEDWAEYWRQFDKHNHCVGIAKWNFSIEEEPVYTRANYQILQDLKLPYEQFKKLADYSIDWIEKIIEGDIFYTYCFLGLLMDRHKPINDYGKAILKNPEMMKEKGVRDYIISLIEKYKDELKCGKLWVKGCFKFFVPDLIMFLEHAGGLPLNGFLEPDEFYGYDYQGEIVGERVIERNPHICHSEHVILTGVKRKDFTKYFSRLINVCIVNSKSIIAQKIQGADFDGDLVLVIDNDIVKLGIDRNSIVVMDIDDKISAKSEVDSKDNKLAVILRTMKNLIGEYSNYSSAYHNKMPKTDEQKKRYDEFISIIGILTGKSIDKQHCRVIQ